MSATETDAHGAHHAAHLVEDDRPDVFSNTGPLIEIWLPMMIVVGLIIVVGATTSVGALIGAVIALLVATAGVVVGAIKLASLEPEDDAEERS